MLSKSGQDLYVVAYYPVPDAIYDESSVDPTRTPASNRLTTPEINNLKNGRLFEVLATVDVSGKDEAAVKTRIENLYASGESNAMNQYKKQFSDYVCQSWDGDIWT